MSLFNRALVIFYFILSHAFSQKEANIWYFGERAGLDFGRNEPLPLTDGRMSSSEGCAVLSDKNTGELMFYTDGETVWNKNHQIMKNGSGLSGSSEATQSALILPYPKKEGWFFLFTISATLLNPLTKSNIHYSIIDVRRDNGLGEVLDSAKNTFLLGDVTEKMTATRQRESNQNYWLVLHGSDNDIFYAYLISELGISEPVISRAGVKHKIIMEGLTGAEGYMKLSPNGKKLACAISSANQRPFQLFNFDQSTGVVSNPITLGHFIFQYGVSFSPDNTKLYLFGIDSLTNENIGDLVFQFDLSDLDSAKIRASKVGLFNQNDTFLPIGFVSSFFALQIGPNGKIYGAGSPSDVDDQPNDQNMVVINRPNEKGHSCDIMLFQQSFDEGKVKLGLPNFIESLFDGATQLNNPNVLCTDSESILFYPNPTENYLNIIVAEKCFSPFELRIYNVAGQRISTYQIREQETTVEVKNLSDGNYILDLIFDAHRVVRKLIVTGS